MPKPAAAPSGNWPVTQLLGPPTKVAFPNHGTLGRCWCGILQESQILYQTALDRRGLVLPIQSVAVPMCALVLDAISRARGNATTHRMCASRFEIQTLLYSVKVDLNVDGKQRPLP